MARWAASAAISFSPRSLTFAQLHTGLTSPLQTVTVSNAGGTLPLTIEDPVTIGGTGAASFSVVENRCIDAVDPGATCQIDVAFTPQTGRAPRAAPWCSTTTRRAPPTRWP